MAVVIEMTCVSAAAAAAVAAEFNLSKRALLFMKLASGGAVQNEEKKRWKDYSALTWSESGQPVGMHVNTQWIHWRHQHIQSQIEFAAIYQKGSVNVSVSARTENENKNENERISSVLAVGKNRQTPISRSTASGSRGGGANAPHSAVFYSAHSLLYNQGFSLRDLRPFIHHFDARASRRCRRLDNPFGILLLVARPKAFESFQVLRQNVSVRHKTEFLLAVPRHLYLQITPNAIFTTDLESAGNMIHFLVWTQRTETRTFHVFAPNAHPVICLCGWENW